MAIEMRKTNVYMNKPIYLFYKDIANGVNKWFDTSGYSKDDDTLPIEINKKCQANLKMN